MSKDSLKKKKNTRRRGVKRWQAVVALIIVIAMVVLALSSMVAYAAEKGRDPSGLSAGQTSVLYDNSIGMPTSEANDIVQTTDGFIYIGSYSGLIRYDGINFERFDSSIGISSVICLYVDSQDRLWIGTNDNGVAMKQGSDFIFFKKEDGLKSLSIRSMQEDKEGNILVATTQGMSYIDKDLIMHEYDDPLINEEYICQLEEGPGNIIYGETLDGDFFYMEDMEIKAYYNGNELGIGTINCICPDPEKEGWIYLGTDKSNIIHGNMTGGMKNYEVRTYPEQNNINAIGFAEGILWICSDDGIGNVDENGRYTKLQNVKMNNSVDDMMEDIEGNVWFVSSRQGVLKITSSIFTDINRLADLPAFVANTTCVYKNDLYIGTDSGLIVLQNKEKSIETPLTEMLADSRIRSIKEDSRGDLWICSYSDSGLICLHSDGTIDTYSTDNGLASNRVRTISEAEDGTMMVSVSGGVYAIKDGEIERSYGSEDGLNNLEILTICPGESGKIYLGSDGDGIYVLEDEKVSRLGLDDGLQSEVILRIKKDPEKEGLYWIITSNSIGYMQDDKITTINEFPYSNNFDICFGNDGYAWILSSGGIYVVNKEDLLENGEIAYTLYDGETGLPYVTTANSRNYVSETGDLYVCGTTGVSEVNIFGDSVSDAQARLVVPYLEADDDIITIEPDTKSITIPASTKRLVIHGYALTYTLGNPTVGYKLQGFDDEMRYTTRRNMRPVTYTNLDGGNYRFMMETVDTATGEVQNEFELSIVKQKALYEMWWFRILVASLIAVAVIIIVRIYIRRKTERLEKEKAEKQELVDETISVFAQCIDMKDNYTRGHSFRVSKYTGLLAERLGYDDEQVHEMKNIALLHDIGKISIPDEILNKQSGLTDEEYEIMKSHASNGYEVLKNVKIMPNLADGAGYHHERLDGKGYPYGKKGDEIPMVAQIIAVADTFDAMYSSRPYRKKMPLREVVSEIERVSGTQLNRDVVKCLVELAEEGLLEDETAV